MMRKPAAFALLAMMVLEPLLAKVPTRYVSTRTRVQGQVTDTRPVRWPGFPMVEEFFHNGVVDGATNSGVDSLQEALAAWTNDPDSTVQVNHGGVTFAERVEDGINTILFGDPAGRIEGSYLVDHFAAGGNLAVRRNHTATRLPSGHVLVAGGLTTAAQDTAERYDPVTHTFTGTGSMNAPRYHHGATLLSSGAVLVAGGTNGTAVHSSAELFDPSSGTFSDLGNVMNAARSEFVMIPFDQGQAVLLAGGTDGTNSLNSGEIYSDAASDSTSLVDLMSARRARPAAAALADTENKILIAGGVDGTTTHATAEVFSTLDHTFSPTGSMTVPRAEATATLMSDSAQSILIAGGFNGTEALDTAEIYNPATGTFRLAKGRMITPRARHRATLLPNGGVLITGGTNGTTDLASAELYDPESETFRPLGFPMSSARAGHSSTLLVDGSVLLAAGGSGTSERYISPISRTLAEVTIYSDFQTHDFAGVTFWNITEVDIVVQDGLTGPGLTNGGLRQLLTHAIGVALGFSIEPAGAQMNPNFDFETPPFGATLQAYDREALSVVYPECPVITSHPASSAVASGETATLTVGVAGGDLTYQWFQNGTIPVGTDSPSFTTPPLTSSTSFHVRVTNNCGFVDSDPATITVGASTVKGDADGNGSVDARDVLYLILYLFGGGSPPAGPSNVNGSGAVDILDVFYLINYLFAGGPAPV